MACGKLYSLIFSVNNYYSEVVATCFANGCIKTRYLGAGTQGTISIFTVMCLLTS